MCVCVGGGVVMTVRPQAGKHMNKDMCNGISSPDEHPDQ